MAKKSNNDLESFDPFSKGNLKEKEVMVNLRMDPVLREKFKAYSKLKKTSVKKLIIHAMIQLMQKNP